MRQWEHKVITDVEYVDTCEKYDEDNYTKQVLDYYGDDGWEVVSVRSEARQISFESMFNDNPEKTLLIVHAIFKRPKEIDSP